MAEINMQYFNIDSLVERLSSKLQQGTLVKGPYEHSEENIWDFMTKKQITQGKYILYYKFPAADTTLSVPVGYVAIKLLLAQNRFTDEYQEAVYLRLEHPLKLKGGRTIPKLGIRLRSSKRSGMVEKDRKDYSYRGFIRLPNADYKNLIPTKWFEKKK